MRVQDLSRFRLDKSVRHQHAALRDLVTSAFQNVTTYREKLIVAGIDPMAGDTWTELSQLPVTERKDFLQRGRQEYTQAGVNLDRCHKSTTSGTSGISLTVYMSRTEAFYRKLLLFRAMLQNVRFTLPFVIVEVGSGEVGLAERRNGRFLNPVQVIRIPRSLPVQEQLDQLLLTKPHIITGHPSCIEVVIERVRTLPAGFAPRLVVCRGEILHERTRALFRETLGCRVVDYYSCDEIGNIAWECPAHPDRLHANADGCLLEIVDEEGYPLPDEEEGAVLVTNLFNRTMPFIRYQLGDRAAWLHEDPRRCACGHKGQSLTSIQGREDDYFWMPDGRKVSPQVINTAMAMASRGGREDRFFLGPYQAIQESIERVRIRAVPLETAPDDITERIAAVIEALGEGITCEVELVDTLPVEPSGKHRKIISWIRKQQDIGT